MLATTEYHMLRTPICRKYWNINRVKKRNTQRRAASTIIVTTVLPVPLKSPVVVLYIPLVQHQNAIIDKKSAAIEITLASSEKIPTMDVDKKLRESIRPPMKRKQTISIRASLYACSALSL